VTSTVLTETPRAADELCNTVGVVTHFHYNDTPYVTQYTAMRNLLIASKIRHIRDAITTQSSFPAYYTYMADLAANGVHVDGVMLMNEPMSTLQAFVTALPNVLESVEAPNEWNLSGDPNWVADITAYQKTLYAGVKGSALTSALPVIGPSLTSYEAYAAVGDLSRYVDEGNMHNYFGAQNPGNSGGAMFPPGRYGSIPFFMGSAEIVSGTKPVATTETGYQDVVTDPTPVTAAVKVKYSMRTLLEQFNAHVARTFFYELIDEGGQNYGLINANGVPKPLYYALKGLLVKLDDQGAQPTFKPLTYTLTAPATVHHTLLQKRDGSYRLMLWIETAATDPVQQTQTVTINTTTKFSTVEQFAWQDDGYYSSTPLTQSSDGTVTLTVSDRVTELKLAP
jgi:hypothetical protein